MPEKKNQQKASKNKKDAFKTKASRSDPDGSYTGVPLNSAEKPVQDADDL
ncbi:MAG TPA: hypothetical protein PLM59_01470 [Oscillospiraceae bacterium]|jgi:hypothetical protein|nr:hypothetical protein [Oscillospiraceae bacterium]HOV40435.1 hypothetical protein [Oscillospiraceae bacterium]